MKQAQKIIDNLSLEYSQIKKARDCPEIIFDRTKKGNREKYSARYAAGTISIQAESRIAALQAFSHLLLGCQSGNLQSYLGEHQAAFWLRPLWVASDYKLPISPRTVLYLPEKIFKDRASCELFCQETIKLGYNSVLFGDFSLSSAIYSEEAHSCEKIDDFFEIFKSYDIKVILKPIIHISKEKISHRSPLYEEYASLLKEELSCLPQIDYLFWESSLLEKDFIYAQKNENRLLKEIVLEEVRLLERLLPAGLIYYLPAKSKEQAMQQSHWFLELCNDVSEKTVLSFAAICNAPYRDHSEKHPFWNLFRREIELPATPLLPIFNIGSVCQGGGLWPILTHDLYDTCLYTAFYEYFAGGIALTPHLPDKRSFLECNLLAFSHFLWRREHPYEYLQTWFSARHPEFQFDHFWGTFQKIRLVHLELSALKEVADKAQNGESFELGSHFFKVKVEMIVSLLKEVEGKVCGSRKNLVVEYFPYFARDVKRMLQYISHLINLPLAGSILDDDRQESFWTRNNQVSLLHKGSPAIEVVQVLKDEYGDPVMNKIRKENCLI